MVYLRLEGEGFFWPPMGADRLPWRGETIRCLAGTLVVDDATGWIIEDNKLVHVVGVHYKTEQDGDDICF